MPPNEDCELAAKEDDVSSSNNEQPIFLLSGSVFKDLICSFLMPNDLVELLKVSGLADPLSVGNRFCRTHGTTTLASVPNNELPRGRRNEQNDDIAFLIWCLEQQAFFAIKENEELPSTNPDCTDCRKARLEGLKKCKSCKRYEPYQDIFTCAGACQRESCLDCHEGRWQCSLCENGATYCCDCFFDGDRYSCEGCDGEFCKSCRPMIQCGVCSEGCCEECSPVFDSFTCSECNETFCFDCRDHHFCTICDVFFCVGCRPGFWCELCQQEFCHEGHGTAQVCVQCDSTACSECNYNTFECQKCLEYRCMECRFSFSCSQCKGEFCDDCQKSNYCDGCSSSFCTSCKDGFLVGFDWTCIDCVRRREGLLDQLKSERNEAEGNECANCFLSEDDMEGVKLKKCSNCKTKYCSRACQKAHWKEHREQCCSFSKDKSATK